MEARNHRQHLAYERRDATFGMIDSCFPFDCIRNLRRSIWYHRHNNHNGCCFPFNMCSRRPGSGSQQALQSDTPRGQGTSVAFVTRRNRNVPGIVKASVVPDQSQRNLRPLAKIYGHQTGGLQGSYAEMVPRSAKGSPVNGDFSSQRCLNPVALARQRDQDEQLRNLSTATKTMIMNFNRNKDDSTVFFQGCCGYATFSSNCCTGHPYLSRCQSLSDSLLSAKNEYDIVFFRGKCGYFSFDSNCCRLHETMLYNSRQSRKEDDDDNISWISAVEMVENTSEGLHGRELSLLRDVHEFENSFSDIADNVDAQKSIVKDMPAEIVERRKLKGIRKIIENQESVRSQETPVREMESVCSFLSVESAKIKSKRHKRKRKSKTKDGEKIRETNISLVSDNADSLLTNTDDSAISMTSATKGHSDSQVVTPEVTSCVTDVDMRSMAAVISYKAINAAIVECENFENTETSSSTPQPSGMCIDELLEVRLSVSPAFEYDSTKLHHQREPSHDIISENKAPKKRSGKVILSQKTSTDNNQRCEGGNFRIKKAVMRSNGNGKANTGTKIRASRTSSVKSRIVRDQKMTDKSGHIGSKTSKVLKANVSGHRDDDEAMTLSISARKDMLLEDENPNINNFKYSKKIEAEDKHWDQCREYYIWKSPNETTAEKRVETKSYPQSSAVIQTTQRETDVNPNIANFESSEKLEAEDTHWDQCREHYMTKLPNETTIEEGNETKSYPHTSPVTRTTQRETDVNPNIANFESSEKLEAEDTHWDQCREHYMTKLPNETTIEEGNETKSYPHTSPVTRTTQRGTDVNPNIDNSESSEQLEAEDTHWGQCREYYIWQSPNETTSEEGIETKSYQQTSTVTRTTAREPDENPSIANSESSEQLDDKDTHWDQCREHYMTKSSSATTVEEGIYTKSYQQTSTVTQTIKRCDNEASPNLKIDDITATSTVISRPEDDQLYTTSSRAEIDIQTSSVLHEGCDVISCDTGNRVTEISDIQREEILLPLPEEAVIDSAFAVNKVKDVKLDNGQYDPHENICEHIGNLRNPKTNDKNIKEVFKRDVSSRTTGNDQNKKLNDMNEACKSEEQRSQHSMTPNDKVHENIDAGAHGQHNSSTDEGTHSQVRKQPNIKSGQDDIRRQEESPMQTIGGSSAERVRGRSIENGVEHEAVAAQQTIFRSNKDRSIQMYDVQPIQPASRLNNNLTSGIADQSPADPEGLADALEIRRPMNFSLGPYITQYSYDPGVDIFVAETIVRAVDEIQRQCQNVQSQNESEIHLMETDRGITIARSVSLHNFEQIENEYPKTVVIKKTDNKSLENLRSDTQLPNSPPNVGSSEDNMTSKKQKYSQPATCLSSQMTPDTINHGDISHSTEHCPRYARLAQEIQDSNETGGNTRFLPGIRQAVNSITAQSESINICSSSTASSDILNCDRECRVTEADNASLETYREADTGSIDKHSVIDSGSSEISQDAVLYIPKHDTDKLFQSSDQEVKGSTNHILVQNSSGDSEFDASSCDRQHFLKSSNTNETLGSVEYGDSTAGHASRLIKSAKYDSEQPPGDIISLIEKSDINDEHRDTENAFTSDEAGTCVTGRPNSTNNSLSRSSSTVGETAQGSTLSNDSSVCKKKRTRISKPQYRRPKSSTCKTKRKKGKLKKSLSLIDIRQANVNLGDVDILKIDFSQEAKFFSEQLQEEDDYKPTDQHHYTCGLDTYVFSVEPQASSSSINVLSIPYGACGFDHSQSAIENDLFNTGFYNADETQSEVETISQEELELLRPCRQTFETDFSFEIADGIVKGDAKSDSPVSSCVNDYIREYNELCKSSLENERRILRSVLENVRGCYNPDEYQNTRSDLRSNKHNSHCDEDIETQSPVNKSAVEADGSLEPFNDERGLGAHVEPNFSIFQKISEETEDQLRAVRSPQLQSGYSDPKLTPEYYKHQHARRPLKRQNCVDEIGDDDSHTAPSTPQKPKVTDQHTCQSNNTKQLRKTLPETPVRRSSTSCIHDRNVKPKVVKRQSSRLPVPIKKHTGAQLELTRPRGPTFNRSSTDLLVIQKRRNEQGIIVKERRHVRTQRKVSDKDKGNLTRTCIVSYSSDSRETTPSYHETEDGFQRTELASPGYSYFGLSSFSRRGVTETDEKMSSKRIIRDPNDPKKGGVKKQLKNNGKFEEVKPPRPYPRKPLQGQPKAKKPVDKSRFEDLSEKGSKVPGSKIKSFAEKRVPADKKATTVKPSSIDGSERKYKGDVKATKTPKAPQSPTKVTKIPSPRKEKKVNWDSHKKAVTKPKLDVEPAVGDSEKTEADDTGVGGVSKVGPEVADTGSENRFEDIEADSDNENDEKEPAQLPGSEDTSGEDNSNTKGASDWRSVERYKHEKAVTDVEYMNMVAQGQLSFMQDLDNWREMYKLDTDDIERDALKLLEGDFSNLYEDLPEVDRAEVTKEIDNMGSMTNDELMKSLR